VTVPVDQDVIEQLARAVFGQISPITGTRATGTIRVDNTGGADDVIVEKNMYLLPVVGGELRDDLVYKTRPDPTTLRAHGQGGAWTVPAGETLDVDIWSNLGGARHNLPAATLFRWDPPLYGLGPTVLLNDALTDGADRDEAETRIQRAAYYEELDAAAIERDLQSGRLYQLPAVMLTWQQSAPAEGRTAGTNQGSTRAQAGARFFSETFRLYVIVGEHSSDKRRRGGGLRVMQALTRLLSDQEQTRDFERLTNVGSLEILARNRYSRSDRHYVYSISFRVMRTVNILEERTFTPWLQTHLTATLPGDPATVTTPITRVDVIDPNPPGPP
jgi:hypothetical protein